MIISVSRRCDIPGFAFDWFLKKLDEGFVEVRNPFNPLQIKSVSLNPPAAGLPQENTAEVFAFWTRDPSSINTHAFELGKRGYGFYVMTTLTSYPAVLEPLVLPAEKAIRAIKELALKITPDRVIWRYDPVFLSDITDSEFHKRNFTCLAAQLKGSVNRVIVSVYDEYGRAEKRLLALENGKILRKQAHYYIGPAGKKTLHPEVRKILAVLADIAASNGMEMQSCAEEDLSDCQIKPGACIDADYIAGLFGEKMPGLKNLGKDQGQKRPFCRCAKSTDIGSYGSCPAGCVYCYANTASAFEN